eukprot:s758_g11.t1
MQSSVHRCSCRHLCHLLKTARNLYTVQRKVMCCNVLQRVATLRDYGAFKEKTVSDWKRKPKRVPENYF